MNRDEIIRMADEAGVRLASQSDTIDPRNVYVHELERFAALVAEEERRNHQKAYNLLSMHHTELLLQLTQAQQMLSSQLNPWQTLKAWVKHTFRKHQ